MKQDKTGQGESLALGDLPSWSECVFEMTVFSAGLTELETTLSRLLLETRPLQRDGFGQNTRLVSATKYLERGWVVGE